MPSFPLAGLGWMIVASLVGCQASGPDAMTGGEGIGSDGAEADEVVVDASAEEWNLRRLRQDLASQERYHDLMSKTLELYDAGEIERAHRAANWISRLFPDESGVLWFAEQTENGEAIPEGDWISFTNRSQKTAAIVELEYRKGPMGFFNFSRVRVEAKDLKPGETRRVYVEDLPQGSVRLYVNALFEDDAFPVLMPHMSGRYLGSEFGFVPEVIINKGGHASVE